MQVIARYQRSRQPLWKQTFGVDQTDLYLIGSCQAAFECLVGFANG